MSGHLTLVTASGRARLVQEHKLKRASPPPPEKEEEEEANGWRSHFGAPFSLRPVGHALLLPLFGRR